MITIDALIEQRKQLAATAANKPDRQRHYKLIEWLTNLRAEVGGDVMVSKTAVMAAAHLTTPAGYAEHLREKGAV